MRFANTANKSCYVLFGQANLPVNDKELIQHGRTSVKVASCFYVTFPHLSVVSRTNVYPSFYINSFITAWFHNSRMILLSGWLDQHCIFGDDVQYF